MRIVGLIIGLLLLAFGGGCILMVVSTAFSGSTSYLLSDPALSVTVLLFLGIVPVVVGTLLLRWSARGNDGNRDDGAGKE